MLRNGTAMVEVRSLDAPPTLTAAATPNVAAPPNVAATLGASPAAAGSASAAAPVADASGDGASPVAVPVPGGLFIQAGAFSDPKNAEHLVERLRGGGYGKVFLRDNEIAGRRMYRVRIGPVSNVAEYDRIVAALERAGINDAHLALD
jgi:rare lipoprotein A